MEGPVPQAYFLRCGRETVTLRGLHKRFEQALFNGAETAGGPSRSSARIGSDVDRQFDVIVARDPSLQVFPFDDFHPFTLRIYACLRSLGLTPLRTQVPIWTEEGQMISFVDLLCVKENGDLVAVELKTGRDGRERKVKMGVNDKKKKEPLTLRPPLNGMADTPLNRALIQAWVGRQLMRSRGVPVVESLAVMVNASRADVLVLSDGGLTTEDMHTSTANLPPCLGERVGLMLTDSLWLAVRGTLQRASTAKGRRRLPRA